MRFKRSHVYMVLLPLAFVAGLATGFLYWGQDQPTPAHPNPTAVVENPQPVKPEEVTRFDVPTDGDPSIGPEDAAVVIVEFSDFSCVYCRKFHTETFPQLLEAYEGQIRFVYRDFPILNPESLIAAQAAECAHEQDMFWEYHDKLFSGELKLGRDTYEQYALDLDMDADALLECIDSGRFEDEVSEDANFVRNLGAGGTPTFFVNGIPMVGAQPFANFDALIREELDQ